MFLLPFLSLGNRIRVQFTITMVNGIKAVFDNSKEDEIKNGLEEQVHIYCM